MDKSIDTINDNGLTYGRGYVYSLQYHIVWCTKYRKQILTGGIEEELRSMLEQIAGDAVHREPEGESIAQ